MVTERIRTGVRVEGIVQGVGFRPFVYSLAARLGLGGLVGNDVDGVFVEVEGAPAAVGQFLRSLERDAPPLARIDRVKTTALAPDGSRSFEIVASEPGGPRRALVSADSATCADCLRELADPADRRYGYPFINCTNCGPRFTIVRDVPYDRPLTTMAGFRMCERCAAEYHDPANRRFHAQPTCCPACGPRLALLDPAGAPWDRRMDDRAGPASGAWAGTGADPAAGGDPVATAAALLRDGQILAIKGLGGYHLAVDAASEKAAATLRERKHREDKPFAVMAQDVAAARRLCEVNEAAAALLTSPRRPIVLLPRRPRTARPMPAGAGAARPGPAIAEAVAPGNRHLGIMLPYTPLHHLLLRAVGRPIVLTSGNVSDEPIAYRDDDALTRLGGIADAFLTHDRAIHIRTDDSVVREFRGHQMPVRRSRGYVPEPIPVRVRFPRPVLACGAELKNTFCLAKDDHVFISHHIGDLENAETLRSFTEGIEHFRRLFDIGPRVVAYDLHPEYLSTKYALDLEGVDLEGVQHHHAHIVSCLADNGVDGPVIGVAFDGTGYGTDGTIWGGEFLVADLAHFRRAGHLAPVPMPGGAAAIKQPWRMAAAYLTAAYPGGPPDGLDVARRNERMWANVVMLARKGINAPVTSSAGRLFDAVSALLGVRDTINYEGQAAVELEQLAQPGEAGAYRAGIEPGQPGSPDGPGQPGKPGAPGEYGSPSQPGSPGQPGSPDGPGQPGKPGAPGEHGSRSQPGSPDGPRAPFRVTGADLVRQAAADLAAGTDRAIIAARFHNGVARLIEEACVLIREREGLIREREGLGTVALSGGVFQNVTLLRQAVARLEARGFRVLVHSRVPCNDGGISLGQAVVAAARDQSTEANL